jgi:hypothetical protein
MYITTQAAATAAAAADCAEIRMHTTVDAACPGWCNRQMYMQHVILSAAECYSHLYLFMLFSMLLSLATIFSISSRPAGSRMGLKLDASICNAKQQQPKQLQLASRLRAWHHC